MLKETSKKTMSVLSYGICSPRDLFEKLKIDGAKLSAAPNPHDVFNFVVTASSLTEWILKFYSPTDFAAPKNSRSGEWTIPDEATSWIVDKTCLPNDALHVRLPISHALTICSHVANASKHYHWKDSGRITDVSQQPQVSNWYQFYFTSAQPDLYVEIDEVHYGLRQIRRILEQFFCGLLTQLDDSERH
jgi:hypothetical protein